MRLSKLLITISGSLLLASCASAGPTIVQDPSRAASTKTGKATILHLEREKDWVPNLSGAKESDLGRLGNGQVIGFRAQ